MRKGRNAPQFELLPQIFPELLRLHPPSKSTNLHKNMHFVIYFKNTNKYFIYLSQESDKLKMKKNDMGAI